MVVSEACPSSIFPVVVIVFTVILGVPVRAVATVLSPVFVPEFVPVMSEVNAIVPLASFSVYVLIAVAAFVKRLVKVLATLRSQRVVSRKVFTPVLVWAVARTISPPPVGAAKVPSPR